MQSVVIILYSISTTLAVPSSVPSFNATAESPTSVVLSWEEPESPNGIITSFVCHYISVTMGISHEGEKTFSGTAREGILSNLEEYVEYRLTMYATTAKGQGNRSKEEFVTTLPAREFNLWLLYVYLQAIVCLPSGYCMFTFRLLYVYLQAIVCLPSGPLPSWHLGSSELI